MYGWQLDKDDHGKHCRAIGVGGHFFDRRQRQVIILPASTIVDGCSSRPILSTMDIVKKALNSSGSKTPIRFSLYTNSNNGYALTSRLRHYQNLPDKPSWTEDGPIFYNSYLKPMLLLHGEQLAELTPEELQTRLSLITIVTHSLGAMVAQDVSKCMDKELQQAGWKASEIADTLKELVVISVAGISRVDYPGASATTFCFRAPNDSMATRIIDECEQRMPRHKGLRRQCGYLSAQELESYGATKEKPKITPLGSGYLIRAFLPDQFDWPKTTNGETQTNRITHKEAAKLHIVPEHDLRNFIAGNEQMGRLLRNTLRNAVDRSAGIGDGHLLFLASTRDAPNLQKWKSNIPDSAGRL